jgi:HPr kinase/phosphorylase
VTPSGQGGPPAFPIHAGCVCLDGRGLLILGPSGAGKSSLALELMTLGARLVADDRCLLAPDPAGGLRASCPPPLRGLIEVRGVGILRAPAVEQTALALVVDLGQAETERLPPRRQWTQYGARIDLVLGPPSRHLAGALLLHLRFGRHA